MVKNQGRYKIINLVLSLVIVQCDTKVPPNDFIQYIPSRTELYNHSIFIKEKGISAVLKFIKHTFKYSMEIIILHKSIEQVNKTLLINN